MKVQIRFDKCSTPLELDAISTYQKGDLFCVKTVDGYVNKYYLPNIFDIREKENK